MERAEKRRRLELSPRDYLVLAALEKWGILGIGQLEGTAFLKGVSVQERAALFFNDYPRSHHDDYSYKRLFRLEQRGYIHPNLYVRSPKLYTLTPKGRKALLAVHKPVLAGLRGPIAESYVRHEITVNGVGLILSELLGLRVSTERERYVWTGQGGRTPAPARMAISDLWIIDSEQPKAVEVELLQKSEKRYQEIWAAYRLRRPANGVVLYLTDWPGGPDCLLDHARRFYMDFIYVCGLKEFREACGLATFKGYKSGQVLTLKGRQSVPEAGPAYQRVSSAEPSASPAQRFRAAPLILPARRKDESVAPLESRAYPHPLPQPSPSPEGAVNDGTPGGLA